MATFLPPIENPSNPMMKFVYGMSRRQFGKVMTPLKVFAARMPLGFRDVYREDRQSRQKAGVASGDA